jgi:hypothetical protein
MNLKICSEQKKLIKKLFGTEKLIKNLFGTK